MRAFEIIAGAKGLFGNDLPAARGEARTRPASAGDGGPPAVPTGDDSPHHERAS
jgi:hypothetical protein